MISFFFVALQHRLFWTSGKLRKKPCWISTPWRKNWSPVAWGRYQKMRLPMKLSKRTAQLLAKRWKLYRTGDYFRMKEIQMGGTKEFMTMYRKKKKKSCYWVIFSCFFFCFHSLWWSNLTSVAQSVICTVHSYLGYVCIWLEACCTSYGMDFLQVGHPDCHLGGSKTEGGQTRHRNGQDSGVVVIFVVF